MDILIKAAAAALTAAVLGLALKKTAPDMTLLLTLAAALFTASLAAGAVGEIGGFFREISDAVGLSPEAVTIVIKTVCIAVLTKLCSDLCRDAGHSALASALEFTGSAAALYLSLPLMRSVVEVVDSLI